MTFVMGGCYGSGADVSPERRDMEQIRETDTLRAATLYSSISYFQYKLQPMGYEYDLIKDFAEA
jgi:membrane-bound lytic murein transglycosylase F